MFKVVIRRQAEKNLNNLDARHKERIVKALLELRKNPMLGEKLWGELAGRRKMKVWPYRMIYTFYKEDGVVYIERIDHRQGAYH